jgi:RNA polymerase sigma factor (sigma-70 family)
MSQPTPTSARWVAGPIRGAPRQTLSGAHRLARTHPPTPLCSGICVLPPPCFSPLLTPPRCPPRCPKPLQSRAVASEILTHVLDHTGRYYGTVLRLSNADQAACMEFIQAGYPCRLSSPEAGLLLLALDGMGSTIWLRQNRIRSTADKLDCIAAAYVSLLERLHTYDPTRASTSTWAHNWMRRSMQTELAEMRMGYATKAPTTDLAIRTAEALARIEDSKERPRTAEELRIFVRRNLAGKVAEKSGMGQQLGALRSLRPIVYRDVLRDHDGEDGRPIEPVSGEAMESAELKVLIRMTVGDAIATTDLPARGRLAQFVGLDRAPEGSTQIARDQGVTANAVRQTLHRTADRIRDTDALGALDEEAVDYWDPEG